MTIERQRRVGGIIIECDEPGCNEEYQISDGVGFDYGWEEAKARGWRAKRIGNDWVHGCPFHASRL
jgi:hypothetical protein